MRELSSCFIHGDHEGEVCPKCERKGEERMTDHLKEAKTHLEAARYFDADSRSCRNNLVAAVRDLIAHIEATEQNTDKRIVASKGRV